MYLRCWETFTLTKESLYFCLSYRGERKEVGLARARIHEVFYPCNRCHLAKLFEKQGVTVTTR